MSGADRHDHAPVYVRYENQDYTVLRNDGVSVVVDWAGKVVSQGKTAQLAIKRMMRPKRRGKFVIH